MKKTYVKEKNSPLKKMLADKYVIISNKEQLIKLVYEKIAYLEIKTKLNQVALV